MRDLLRSFAYKTASTVYGEFLALRTFLSLPLNKRPNDALKLFFTAFCPIFVKKELHLSCVKFSFIFSRENLKLQLLFPVSKVPFSKLCKILVIQTIEKTTFIF